MRSPPDHRERQLLFRSNHVDFETAFRFRGSRPFTLQSTRMLSTSARRKPAVPAATNTPNGGDDAGASGHDANGGAKFRERIHRLHVMAVSFPPKAVPLRAPAA
jgi:hypothetical protein